MKYPDFSYEQTLASQGFSATAGIDEVGRGSWAGPVVAAAVIFPHHVILRHAEESPADAGSRIREGSFSAKADQDDTIRKIRDSKTLSKKQRNELNSWIKHNTIWAIGECTSVEIDRLGIGKATRLAMTRAVDSLSNKPDHLLIDGKDTLETSISQQTIIDGDVLVLSVAAASIVAKVYRDTLMEQLHEKYPPYGFASHVGYGTKAHIQALAKFGPCDIHRFSYKPVQKYLQ